MAILIDERTRVVVQGITGHQGSFHTGQMLDYGTRVVAGVSPGKEGQEVRGVPVYDTVEAAVEKHGATASVVFVPAPFAKDAVLEALDAGIKLVVVITEHVPLHDAMEIMARARLKGATVVGPNTFGVISPGKSKIGIMPNAIYTPGRWASSPAVVPFPTRSPPPSPTPGSVSPPWSAWAATGWWGSPSSTC